MKLDKVGIVLLLVASMVVGCSLVSSPDAYVKDASGKIIVGPQAAALIAASVEQGEYTIVRFSDTERTTRVKIGDGPEIVVNPAIPVAPRPVAPPKEAVDAATYIYEKDQTAIPAGVLSGLNRLNREKKILATAYEEDSSDGTGEVPDQYKEALIAAREAGLPALVLLAKGKVVKAIKDPKTADEVWEACK